MNDFEYAAAMQQIKAAKTIKRLEELWRFYHQLSCTELPYYSKIPKDTFATAVRLFKILTLVESLFNERSSRRMPDKFIHFNKILNHQILLAIYDSPKDITFDDIIDIFQYTEVMQSRYAINIQEIATIIEIVGTNTLPYEYKFTFNETMELRGSPINAAFLFALIEWRNKDYDNRKQYTLLNKFIKVELNRRIKQDDDKIIQHYEDYLQAAKDVAQLRKEYTPQW